MTIHGPALPEKGLALPAGSGLDERGFLTIGTREV
jgi:hypothetical protein